MESPLFKAVVKNIVHQFYVERGIPTLQSIPGTAQNDVLDAIAAVITSPVFAQLVHEVNTWYSGLPDSKLPPGPVQG